MDNQQVTTEKIAWLSGIWDGEGTFSIVKQYVHATKNSNFGLNPKVTMENTSSELLEESCKILDSIGITYYISEREPRSEKHKKSYVLQICRLDMIIKFCDVLIPYLISKKAQASLLRRYALSRIRVYQLNGKKVPYNDKEVGICQQLQSLNKLGPVDTSTTLRKTLNVQLLKQKRWIVKRDEKIKSELYGDIQNEVEIPSSPIIIGSNKIESRI